MVEKKQILIIQYMRGIAALSVCLFHFMYTTTNFIESTVLRSIFGEGKLGVQVFFVISGLVITWALSSQNINLNTLVLFVKKRVVRIEPPYVASLILCLIYFKIRQISPFSLNAISMPDIKTILMHFFYLIPFAEQKDWLLPVYWTLGVEFQFYLWMCLVIYFGLSFKLAHRLIFYGLFLIPFVIQIFSIEFIFHWSPLFLIGSVYALFKKNIISNIETWSIITLCLILIFCYMSINIFCATLMSILTIHFLFNLTLKIKSLLWLGEISYSLYLIHVIIGGSVVNYLSHLCQNDLQRSAVVFLGVLITFLGSNLFYMKIEKPFKKLASNLNT